MKKSELEGGLAMEDLVDYDDFSEPEDHEQQEVYIAEDFKHDKA